MSGNGRGVGRPRIEFTAEQVVQIEALASCLTQEQIADWLGISDRTLRDRIKNDEAISAAYKKGRAKAVERMADRLYMRGLGGDTTAAIFYLKTQAGWKETHRVESEENVNLNVNVNDARERVVKRVDRIAARN